jgi:hypothetical protein
MPSPDHPSQMDTSDLVAEITLYVLRLYQGRPQPSETEVDRFNAVCNELNQRAPKPIFHRVP